VSAQYMGGTTIAFLLQEDPDPFRVINDFLNSPILTIGFRVAVLFFVVLWISLAYWTFQDAGRRGTIRFFWGIAALIFPFLGPLIYLIVRPPEYVLDSRERELELAVLERELKQRVNLCPNCRSVVEKEYLLCPVCGWDLKKPCDNCGRPLHLDWRTCPYCATVQREKKINW
jgi:RNA polymerase subunit RPABC4/transcription elongation factor Spt4